MKAHHSASGFRAAVFRGFRFRKSVLPFPWPELCRMLRFSFHDWLLQKASLAQATEWDFGEGALSYPDWPEDYQRGLEEAFWRLGGVPVADPPPNLLTLADDDEPRTTISAEHAWNLYRATAGHVLAAEFAQLFPWSLNDYDYGDLIVLLSGRWMFTYYAAENGYRVVEDGTPVIPAPPEVIYPFLTDNALIGDTRLTTIANLLEWCRQNLNHLIGHGRADVFEHNWQYRGTVPVSRIIARTPNTNDAPGYGDDCVVSRTPGCWGTTGFLMSVLRTVNIPVKLQLLNFADVSHATPYFPSEDRWLSHGDDPYNANAHATPPYDAAGLLIDRPTYEAYFGPQLTEDQRRANIGRRVGYDLCLQHWPDYTLHQYCDDIAAGRTGTDSEVYQSLSRYETIDTATWDGYRAQMQQKIDAFGGCTSVPESWKTWMGLCG